MVSICMATYNGERYLREQLTSILIQISRNDEVVIVDDASTDQTLSIIRAMNDTRVRLFTSVKNNGHVYAFERAIKLASGDVIILSDQDDIWASNKYYELISTFNDAPEIVMIVHGLSIIDSDAVIVSVDWLRFKEKLPNRGLFLFRQLLRSNVFGSALAFRRNLLSLLLPFPRCVYAHDHWLAISAAFRGGIKLHSGQLVFRRIHSHNVTPVYGLPAYKSIYYRGLFLWLIFIGLCRITNEHFFTWRRRWKI
jgi:glycosyltransferase involved in cell wall biosynthesis